MKRLLLWLVPALALAGCKSSEPADVKPVVHVSVQRAQLVDVPLVVHAPATLFAKQEAHITSRLTAAVQQMLFHKGESVRKGQLLVVLEQRDLAAQRADAVAGVSSAEASLQKTVSGTVPTALTQARGDVATKRAAVEFAQKVFDRRQQLLKDGAISGRDLETSRVQLTQAQADFNAAQKNLETLERHTSADDIRMARSAVAQSRAREALANANLGFASLRSPFDGTITEQNAFPGDLANPGSALLTVDDMSSAVARAQVNADEAGPVRVGQVCSFFLRQGDESRRFGHVVAVNQAVDTARRTVEVWCEIANTDGALKSGLFGNVEIAVGSASNSVVLPSSAVEFVEGTDRAKVYTVDGQQVAHLREVSAKRIDQQHVRNSSGLSAGDLVITAGQYGIPDGTSVKPDGAQ